MYAVFESGGKQHRVAEGDILRLELIESEAGATLDFDKVLLIKGDKDLKVGAPYVEGGKVSAEVLTHGRAAKVKIVKFRRRKHSRTQMGHRQWYTEVKITGISG